MPVVRSAVHYNNISFLKEITAAVDLNRLLAFLVPPMDEAGPSV